MSVTSQNVTANAAKYEKLNIIILSNTKVLHLAAFKESGSSINPYDMNFGQITV